MNSHFAGGKESFYALSADKGLKMYTIPHLVRMTREEKLAFKDAIPITNVMGEYFDHQKAGGIVKQSILRDWLYTCGSDGAITIRSLMEPEKAVKIVAHESIVGGVKDFTFIRVISAFSFPSRTVVSLLPLGMIINCGFGTGSILDLENDLQMKPLLM